MYRTAISYTCKRLYHPKSHRWAFVLEGAPNGFGRACHQHIEHVRLGYSPIFSSIRRTKFSPGLSTGSRLVENARNFSKINRKSMNLNRSTSRFNSNCLHAFPRVTMGLKKTSSCEKASLKCVEYLLLEITDALIYLAPPEERFSHEDVFLSPYISVQTIQADSHGSDD